MASKSDPEDEAMTPVIRTRGQRGPEGNGGGESRMELGDTHHGRLSVVLCHECQSVHYELKCDTSSALAKHIADCEQGPCRNSITWDEFFGSSLELAPSLLSIYDNLAASSAENHHDVADNNQDTTPTSSSTTTDSGSQLGSHARSSHSHSCVTPACAGFWVTDRCHQQRLFVRASSGLPCRPLSLMEPSTSAGEAGMDKDNVKKRPLSISSLSSVSSTSLPRLQHKRPNLSQDGEGSCSDHASQTSSDSNLMSSDRVSLTSDRVSMTSDRVSLTSDPVSLASDRMSLTSTEEAGVTVPVRYAVSGDHREVESSVDPEYTNLSQPASVADRPLMKLDSCGDHHQDLPTSSSLPSPSLSSRASSCSSVSSLPAFQQHSLGTSQANHSNNNIPQQIITPTPSLGDSSVDEASRRQPVRMRPLQTTTRPVVINVPDFMRKPRSSSSCVDGERCDGVSSDVKGGEGGEGSRLSSASSATLTPGSPHRSVSSSSMDSALSSRAGSFGASGSCSVSAREDGAGCPNGESVSNSNSRVSARHSLITSGVRSLSGLSSSNTSAPQSPSTHRTSAFDSPVSPRRADVLQPFQMQSVAQQSSSSPLSPTAIARRRFLASHFDIPDVPPLDDSHDDSRIPQAGKSAKDDSSPGSSPRRSTSLTVPSSLSFNRNSDASPMSSPCGSPGSARHSAGEDMPTEGAQNSASQGFNSHLSEDFHSVPYDAVSQSSTHSGESPTASSSPPTRGRSSRKAEGGAVGGRGGSVKATTYVTYVQRVVTEIVETERMYVDSLEAIIKGYLEPLENMLGNSATGQEDLACLFCNIADIYAFGKVFLSDLEQCGLDPVKVADCFVKHNNGFVIYTDYCTNYPRAVEVLTRFMQDAELSEVCKACQMALGHGLPLGAYLLRPVQRILKYHLLLQNILKNFDKTKSGHATLEKALDHMTAMAHHINEMKRRHEHAVRIQEVQSQLEDYSGEDLTRLGELVLEGSFRVYGAKASRQVFLFERGILISKKKEGGMLTCKAFVPCSNLMLVEVIPNEPLSFHIIPFDNPRAQHTLQARSMEQKRHWCQDIKRLILESYKGRIPDNVKSLVMELGRNHDNDYVGKDTHDSPWKHQHTAPEYLEKRRFRRKSGGKGPDTGPLLKLPKPGGKRDQAGANKSKSPKVWRKSDAKPVNTRERSESLPRMLASASSVIGIAAPKPLRSESFNRQNSSSSSHGSPYSTADGNNNKQNKNFKSPSGPAASRRKEEDQDAEAMVRRTASFKRAMRMKPLYSQDLDDIEPKDVPMADDTDPGRKAGDRLSRSDRFKKNGQQEQVGNRGSGVHSYTNTSSPSDFEDSSDTDCEDQRVKQVKDHKKKANMYSSMPALNSLERRPAQKRRPGETKSGLTAQTDLSKSSDTLAEGKAEAAESSSTRQYRRRWEGKEDGLQKKVPALHDTYGRRSRENLLRKKGKNGMDSKMRKSSSGARLTDWGSVDKLTHGSLSDLSHLKEDPWVRAGDSPCSTPRARDASASLTSPDAHSRSRSLTAMQSKDWNPGAFSPAPIRPRNYSDVSEVMRKSGKENLDWMVYVKRNSGEQDRERANSLSQMNSKPRTCSAEFSTKALRDSNCNISRSLSLCEDTMKRYSLDLSDKQKLPGDAGIPASPKEVTAGEGLSRLTTEEDKQKVDLTMTSASDDVEMTDVTRSRTSPPVLQSEQPSHLPDPVPQSPAKDSGSSPHSSQPPASPSPSRGYNGVHQLLSPTPFSSVRQEAGPVTAPVHSVSSQDLTQRQREPQTPQTQRPLSPHTAALSAEGERMVAEMEKYYEANSPQTPTLAFKFPPTSQSYGQPSEEAVNSANPNVNVNRLSGVSSVSSSSNDGYLNPSNTLHDPNPNRLSGVSSISTSSYESQNSNSSDSLVGTLKNKLSVWTHKLGGKRSREEELSHHHHPLSASRDGLSSPTLPRSNAELQEVLREHSLGSPLIGSRMANTVPFGMETHLSPPLANDQALSSYEFSSKEGTPEPQTRFSYPSAVLKQSKADSDVFPVSTPVQQSDSGISMYSGESHNSRSPRRQGIQKANTLPSNIPSLQQFAGEPEKMDGIKRRDSVSSTESGDSFYERRLSVAFDASVFKDQTNLENQKDEPQSPAEARMGPRKSIREVVQFIEEKFRPRHPPPVEVKRKEPSALIRQRLQSLRDNASYKLRRSNRSVSEDRGRMRDRTPESPRLPRPENRSRSCNQFMHRVQAQPYSRMEVREGDRDKVVMREQDMKGRAGRERGREGEEGAEGGGGCAMSGSMDRLDQLSSDVDNLVIMRGWVRSLINKFQQIT